MNQYYVYIMTNDRWTLYTGVTNDLARRVYEHNHKLVDGFTKKYNITKLVHYETTNDVRSANAREKQIKGWLRSKKVALMNSANPDWRDLASDWDDPSRDRLDPSCRRAGTQGDRVAVHVIPSPTGNLGPRWQLCAKATFAPDEPDPGDGLRPFVPQGRDSG
jgi:putative endonuclease